MSSRTINQEKLIKAVAKTAVKCLPIPPLAYEALSAVIDSFNAEALTQPPDSNDQFAQMAADTVQKVSGAFDGLEIPEFILDSIQTVVCAISDPQELVVSLDLDERKLWEYLKNQSGGVTISFGPDEVSQFERVLLAVAQAVIANAEGLRDYVTSIHRALLSRASATQQTVTNAYALEQTMAADVAEIKAVVLKGNMAEGDVANRTPSEERWDGIVDAAKAHLEAGEFRAAQTQLHNLRSQLESKSPSPRLQCRIASNLGVAALHLGDLPTAARETERAMACDPSNIAALTNGASVALLSADADRALTLAESARALKPDSPEANATYVQALLALGKKETVDLLLIDHPWVAYDPLCCLTLGEAAFQAGDFDRAEQYLRRSLETQPLDARTHFLLGLTLLQPALKALMTASPLDHRQPPDVLDRLRSAEAELTEALSPNAKRSDPGLKRDVLVNRAAARGALHDFAGALADCDTALREDPDHGMALYNKGMLLLRQGRFPEAAKALRASSSVPNAEREIPLAAALIETSEYDEAIGIIQPLWQSAESEARALPYADLLLTAYDARADVSAAEELVREIMVRFPDDPEAGIILGDHWRRQGQPEIAAQAFQPALDSKEAAHRDIALQHLALMYFTEGAWAKAVEYFARIVDTASDNPLLRRYVVCLVNARRYAEVLRIARPIREAEGPKPLISEGEACALAYVGDLDAAIPLLYELAELEPKRGSHHVNVVLALRRQGDDQGARSYIESIPEGALDEDPPALMRIAAQRAALKMPGALETAFRARDLDYQNPDAHIDYMSICLHVSRTEAEAATQPTVDAQVDCRVELKGETDALHFTIRGAADQKHGESREIGDDSATAKAIIGKRAGETVVFEEGGIGERRYVVTEVLPKHVAAFRNSSDLFKDRVFPQSRIQIVDVTEEGFGQRLADHLDAAYRRSVKVMDLYAQGPLPLSTLAEVGSHTLIETWEAMASSPAGKIFATRGAPDDAEEQQSTIANAGEVVMDLTAVLSIVHLGIEESVAQRFPEIVVPQHVQDEVREHIFKLSDTGPTGGMWSEGIVRHFVEPDPVEHANRLEFARRVLAFITTHSRTVPVYALAEASPRVSDALGLASAAAVALAQERNASLYSDDGQERAFAKTENSVRGFSSPELLSSLHMGSVLTEDAYYSALTTLITANYRYLRVSADYLLWVLRKNGYRGTLETRQVFRAFEGLSWDEHLVLGVLATVAVRVAREATPLHASLVLDLCVSTALAGRRGRRTFQVFGKMIKDLTKQEPLLSARLLSDLEAYSQLHVIGP